MKDLLDRTALDSDVCHGQPCIQGTRILVSVVLRLVEEGLTFTQIEEEFPELTDDIRAAIRYARLTVEHPLKFLHNHVVPSAHKNAFMRLWFDLEERLNALPEVRPALKPLCMALYLHVRRA